MSVKLIILALMLNSIKATINGFHMHCLGSYSISSDLGIDVCFILGLVD